MNRVLCVLGFIITIISTGCGRSPKHVEFAEEALPEGPRQTAAQAYEYRLEWNLRTLRGDYEQQGRRNPKWDEHAVLALENFAQLRAGDWLYRDKEADQLMRNVAEATRNAITNGCNDPMIQYFYARYERYQIPHDALQHAEPFRAAAEALLESPRATIRKYYAALRASENSRAAAISGEVEVQRWRVEARRLLLELVQDKEVPGGEVYDACDAFFKALPKSSPLRSEVYFELEPHLFRNWPVESSMYLLKGWFYTDYAWDARGSSTADQVTGQGWVGFARRLETAEKALHTAWRLNPSDPRIARQMLSVELGQGQGRDRMEQWFQRAMALNTNYYEACDAKMYYLEPKWYGSHEDMLEFAGECLRSTKWGGSVPLIVVNFHNSVANKLPAGERREYWTRPEVWKDVEQAYTKLFSLHPDWTGYHHNFAFDAYRAQQWDVLNRELKLMGKVNYAYFGGREKFDQIVAEARAHAR